MRTPTVKQQRTRLRARSGRLNNNGGASRSASTPQTKDTCPMPVEADDPRLKFVPLDQLTTPPPPAPYQPQQQQTVWPASQPAHGPFQSPMSVRLMAPTPGPPVQPPPQPTASPIQRQRNILCNQHFLFYNTKGCPRGPTCSFLHESERAKRDPGDLCKKPECQARPAHVTAECKSGLCMNCNSTSHQAKDCTMRPPSKSTFRQGDQPRPSL